MNVAVQDILEKVRDSARFRWPAVLVAWCICLVGWSIVILLPDVYESSARVFVDTRTPLTHVIQGIAIQQDVEVQLNLVQQSLLGFPQLEKIARETIPSFGTVSPETRTRVLSKLQRNIRVLAQGTNAAGIVYTIRYDDSDRDRSLKVVQLLLNTFVEDTLGGKRSGSEAAQKFLKEQIQENEGRLREAEQRLADFKKQNVATMPGEQGDYFTRLQNELDAERKIQTALSVAFRRHDELSRQFRGELSFASAPDPVSRHLEGSAPDSGDTAAQIRATQAKLDELLLKFTDEHPDVASLRAALDQLKVRRRAELEALRRGDLSTLSSNGVSTNPVFQSIQLALNQSEVEIASLRGELSEHRKQISELRGIVNTVPQVEAEFARLNRDYDVTKSQYIGLVERLEKSKLGQDAEPNGSVRFSVVDPPSAKFQPISPNRPLLLGAIFFVAILTGPGLAYGLHELKPAFNTSRALHSVTGLPVIGVVSLTWLDEHERQARLSWFGFLMAAATLLVGFIVVLQFHQDAIRLLGR